MAKNSAGIKQSDKREDTPLERMLKTIQSSEDFPSISKYLIDINRRLADNTDASNASELANVILNDYALTNKLLKLVNSAYFGLAAGRVTTVSRAVVVLGYEYIRLATISLTLFEHFQSKPHTVDLKETVVSSFWCGVLAREIARMDAGVDPEEAFVCAMMGQLGKMVMIYYLPDEYRKIGAWNQACGHGGDESKAVKAACGVTYEELGAAVAKKWNFPEQICESLQVLTRDDLRNKRELPGKLKALSSFVKELSRLIQTGGLSDGDQAVVHLLDLYRSRIKISKRQLKTLIQESLTKVRDHAQALDFSVASSDFINRLGGVFKPANTMRTAPAAAENVVPATESFWLTDGKTLKDSSSLPTASNPKDIIVEGIEEISQTMMTDYDVNDVALMSLEILYRAFGFHRALMFIRENAGRKMTVRFGYGRHCRRLMRKVGFNVQVAKDLFNLSIQAGKDLIVADAHDGQINHLIPAWYRSHIDAPAFLFLPVTVQKVCVGAFYADREQRGQPITSDEHRHLSMLRNQLILAIQYRQGRR